jgi:hypothetical protein
MRQAKAPGCEFLNMVFVVLLASVSGALGASPGVFKAGFAKVDITPTEPVVLAGYGSRTALSTGVHDPLFVRATVLESGPDRLVLVATDTLGFYDGTYELYQKKIADELGIEDEKLFLTAIHTHAAPKPTWKSAGGVESSNSRYTLWLGDRIVEAVRLALDDLKPARLGLGRGASPVGVNRRETTPDGGVTLGRNPGGIHDAEVILMSIARDGDEPAGLLYNYATHATSLGAKNLEVSSDLVGRANGFVERFLGPGVVSSMFVGASADIDPWYRVLPGFRTEKGFVPETELLGNLLGVEVVHVKESISEFTDTASIRSARKTLQLPGKHRGTAASADREASPPAVEVSISAARVGDVGLVGISAEVLTAIGLRIKEGSPFPYTWVITHCNGASGYLPPLELYKEGGYEIETSPFAPGAAEVVAKEALMLLYSLRD